MTQKPQQDPRIRVLRDALTDADKTLEVHGIAGTHPIRQRIAEALREAQI